MYWIGYYRHESAIHITEDQLSAFKLRIELDDAFLKYNVVFQNQLVYLWHAAPFINDSNVLPFPNCSWRAPERQYAHAYDLSYICMVEISDSVDYLIHENFGELLAVVLEHYARRVSEIEVHIVVSAERQVKYGRFDESLSNFLA